MLQVIKYNLSHLTDFSGRDARCTFWWYVLAVVLLQVLITMVAVIPMVGSIVSAVVQASQSGPDEQAIEQMMLANMAEWLGTLLWFSAASNILAALLVFAAFVRRLHDSGHSGWWAAIPMATQAVSMALGFHAVGDMQDLFLSAGGMAELQTMQSQIGYSTGSLVSWAGYLVFIGLGVLNSQDGPNRYGEAPVRLSA